jgi:hypothetical protein
VSKHIVHVFEVVQVDVMHGNTVAFVARSRELFVQQLEKLGPVR